MDPDADFFEDELSEEDQQLKDELEMLVERLKVRQSRNSTQADDDVNANNCSQQEPDTSLYGPALDAIKNFIKTSTSSMTAVPKPLKFLRPHYDDLAALYEKWTAGPTKVGLIIRIFTMSRF